MYLLKLKDNLYSLRYDDKILMECGASEMIAFSLWNYNISKKEMIQAIELLDERKLKISFDKNLKIVLDS